MYIHYFLKKQHQDEDQNEEQENAGSFFDQIKQYMTNGGEKKFFYNIAGYSFTLEEVKHGLLRNNSKAPGCYMRQFSSSDERLQILSGYFNPKILFVCLDFPECLE